MTFCHGLKLTAPDGKLRETDCANPESIFRIIRSIPSPKAEPFKRWLAKVGYERVQEIEDPALADMQSKKMSEIVYDATVVFCDRFIGRRSRTHDRTVQAVRSCKLNITGGHGLQ